MSTLTAQPHSTHGITKNANDKAANYFLPEIMDRLEGEGWKYTQNDNMEDVGVYHLTKGKLSIYIEEFNPVDNNGSITLQDDDYNIIECGPLLEDDFESIITKADALQA